MPRIRLSRPIAAAFPVVAAIVVMTLGACHRSCPSEYTCEMARVSTTADIAKQAWLDIVESRKRGEQLDANYVVDVGNLYLTSLRAGIGVAGAAANHESPKEAREDIEAANAMLAKLVASGKLSRTPGK